MQYSEIFLETLRITQSNIFIALMVVGVALSIAVVRVNRAHNSNAISLKELDIKEKIATNKAVTTIDHERSR